MVEEDKTVKKAAKTSVKKAAVKSVKKAAKTSVKEVVAAPEKKVSPAPEKKAAKKSAQKSVKLLSLTLIRSKHGRLASHKACVAGLGLRRMHQRVEVIDTPENRGMIKKVHYLLNVEEV